MHSRCIQAHSEILACNDKEGERRSANCVSGLTRKLSGERMAIRRKRAAEERSSLSSLDRGGAIKFSTFFRDVIFWRINSRAKMMEKPLFLMRERERERERERDGVNWHHLIFLSTSPPMPPPVLESFKCSTVIPRIHILQQPPRGKANALRTSPAIALEQNALKKGNKKPSCR